MGEYEIVVKCGDTVIYSNKSNNPMAILRRLTVFVDEKLVQAGDKKDNRGGS